MEMKCKKCGAVFGQMIGVTLCLPNGFNVTDKFRAVAPCGHWVKWFPPEENLDINEHKTALMVESCGNGSTGATVKVE